MLFIFIISQFVFLVETRCDGYLRNFVIIYEFDNLYDSHFTCKPHKIRDRYIIFICKRVLGETCCAGYKWNPIIKNCTSEYFFVMKQNDKVFEPP